MQKAFGRAIFALAAGLMIFALPLHGASAAPAGDEAATEQPADAGKPLSLVKTKKPRVQKASRKHKPAKVAAVRPAKREAAKTAVSPASAAPMPDTVANANAQMPATEAHGGAAAIDITPPPLEAAAADQLTELDKALAAAPPEEPQQMAQLAAPVQPPAAEAPAPHPAQPATQARASTGNDAWAQSSLIGKIFIAFGGMLTLASAARMLIA